MAFVELPPRTLGLGNNFLPRYATGAVCSALESSPGQANAADLFALASGGPWTCAARCPGASAGPSNGPGL
jgi:hypothetical protein